MFGITSKKYIFLGKLSINTRSKNLLIYFIILFCSFWSYFKSRRKNIRRCDSLLEEFFLLHNRLINFSSFTRVEFYTQRWRKRPRSQEWWKSKSVSPLPLSLLPLWLTYGLSPHASPSFFLLAFPFLFYFISLFLLLFVWYPTLVEIQRDSAFP